MNLSENNHSIDLHEIKEKIIISDFARSALGLRVLGNKTMCCHLHKETTPSLHFNDEKKFYYCFGCHKSGDVFSLIQEIKTCSFLEAVKIAADHVGVNIDDALGDYNFLRNSTQIKEKKDLLFKMMEDICIYFEKKLFEASDDSKKEEKSFQKNALNYLYGRKIDNDLIKKFRIGYCPENTEELINLLKTKYQSNINLLLDSGIFKKNLKFQYTNQKNSGFYSILNNRIIFPIFDKFHNVIAFGGRIIPGIVDSNDNEYKKKMPKYINAADSLIFKKNEVLYAENFALVNAKSKNQIILVEGYIDVIMMHKIGLQNTVAPLGTAVSDWQIKYLWNFIDEITCAMDGDLAGYKSMVSVLKKALLIVSATKFINFIFLEKNSDPANLIEEGKISVLNEKLEKKRYPAQIIFNLILKKYKKITTEVLAAIRAGLNSYLEMINDDLIKNEYKIYFEKKIQSLSEKEKDQMNQEDALMNNEFKFSNQNTETENKLYNNRTYKNKYENFNFQTSVFDEIFFYIVILIKNFNEKLQNIFESDFKILINFFDKNYIFKDILFEVLKNKNISINEICEKIKQDQKYLQINLDSLVEKNLEKISKESEKIQPEKLWKKYVIFNIEIIKLKNKKKDLEERIANNDKDLSITDFENLGKINAMQKKIQLEIQNLEF